jgi:hypothetical protein
MREDDWDEVEDDDADDVIPCPSCGEDVYDDADWCPSCRQFITRSTSPWSGKPRWWIVAGLLGIGSVIWLSLGPIWAGFFGN